MEDLTMRRIIIIIILLSLVFAVSLVIVQYVEVNKHREDAGPEPVVSSESRGCVDCHGQAENSPNLVLAWERSKHAEQGIDCMSCHTAARDDFDYYSDSNHLQGVASHPTPKDCAECHDKEVTEFARSKHGATAMIFMTRSFDRNVLEPTITTKHGCQECHEIGHMWPDQSVGECDACHSKHTFDVAIARDHRASRRVRVALWHRLGLFDRGVPLREALPLGGSPFRRGVSRCGGGSASC